MVSTRWLTSRQSGRVGTNRASRRTPHLRRDARKLHLEHLEDRTLLDAAIWTSLPDYAPMTTARIAGSGFGPGETVQLSVVKDAAAEVAVLQGVADANGDLPEISWEIGDWVGSILIVTATGQTTGLSAQTQFTDAISGYQEGGVPTGTCTNPANAQTSNDVRATCTNGQTLVGGGFGLQALVPASATAISFTVQVEARVSNNNNTDVLQVQLSWDGGATWTAATNSDEINATTVGDTVGTAPSSGACSTFGRTWSFSELSDANFRVRLTAAPVPTTDTFGVDDFDVRVCSDSRIITAAHGGVALPSGSVPVSLTVEHTGQTSPGNDWKSTKYQVDGLAPVCVNTPDHTSSGSDSEGFNITAPAAVGVYSLTFTAYSDNSCTTLASDPFTIPDGVRVGNVFADSFGLVTANTVPGWT